MCRGAILNAILDYKLLLLLFLKFLLLLVLAASTK